MTSVISILQDHERPWYEVQQQGRTGSWATVARQCYDSDKKCETPKQIWDEFRKAWGGGVSLGLNYRIWCPKTGHVVWQGKFGDPYP